MFEIDVLISSCDKESAIKSPYLQFIGFCPKLINFHRMNFSYRVDGHLLDGVEFQAENEIVSICWTQRRCVVMSILTFWTSRRVRLQR